MIIRGQEILFVDGYNVIHSWQKLKGLARVNLDGARQSLLDFMAEYQAYTGVKVIVVFDAQSAKGTIDSKDMIVGLEVVFTGAETTADDYIERQVHLLGKVKRIRVATSDFLEQQMVLSRGATRVSARELELELAEMKRQIQAKESKRRQSQKDRFSMVEDQLDPDTKDRLQAWMKNNEKGSES